jgi:hypothetical protein
MKVLGDYTKIQMSEVQPCTAHSMYELYEHLLYEIVAGYIPDIIDWLEYHIHQPVWFNRPAAFPVVEHQLERWPGIAHRVDQAFCCWILPVLGIPITRSTVQPVSIDDLATKAVIVELASLDVQITECFVEKIDKYSINDINAPG